MTFAIVIAIAIVFAVAISLSRQSSRNKKQAIADLAEEKKAIGTFNILELVESEVQELGLTKVEGARDIPLGVLLKVWNDRADVVASCVDVTHLRYVVSQGTPPADATQSDVTLECSMKKTRSPDT